MIIRDFTTPTGTALAVHRLRRVEILYPDEQVLAYVDAWGTMEAFVAGAPPGWSHTPIPLPLASCSTAEAWLVGFADSPLAGGSVVADPTDALDSVKSRCSARILAARNAAIAGGFEVEGYTFGCDLQSQVLILGACLRATRAQSVGAPGSMPAGQWTLKNEEVVDLTIDETIAMGEAMGDHIVAMHATYRDLRDLITVAPDAETATGVTWPDPV